MMVLGQYRSVLVDTLWYWVSMELYLLVHGGLVAMDQYKAVMVDPRWHWVSIGRYWLVLGGTG